MNVILRNSTRRMIDASPAAGEAESFVAWMRAECYTDYVIDCHIRRLLSVMPRPRPPPRRRFCATPISRPSLAANAIRSKNMWSTPARKRGLV
jgi:hypothetical protein